VRRRPAAVLRAGSVADVVRVVRHARQAGLHVVARGAGHTTYGQAQIDGGVVVDLRHLDRIHSLTGETATVEAGITWSALVGRTTAAGAIPPVLPDFLDLTVGGTLSAGGVTGTSFLWGAQIDNVAELVVVTGGGDVVTCSPSQERELFDVVLGGFGQVAIIVRATIRLSAAPASVEVFRLPYEDPASMMADLRALVDDGRFEYLLGLVTPTETGGWKPSIEAAVGRDDPRGRPTSLDGLGHLRADEQYEVRSLDEWVRRVDEPVGVLRDLGLWDSPHPWLDLFVGDSVIDTMLSEVLCSSVSRGVGPLRILLYPLRRSRLSRPMLRLPEEDDVFLLDVLSTAAPSGGSAMVTANRSLFERNRELGGTVYPISAVPLDPADWRRQLGARWPWLAALKHRFDPAGVLRPGTGVFDGAPQP
jgi:FAD/FMN-containing dehydrogenase